MGIIPSTLDQYKAACIVFEIETPAYAAAAAPVVSIIGVMTEEQVLCDRASAAP